MHFCKNLIFFFSLICIPFLGKATDITTNLHRVEKQLDAIKTLRANFTQKNSDGTIFKGELFLKRPGYIKFLYDVPAEMVIVSNGERLIYFDPSTHQTSYLPLENSPAQLLLEAHLDFTKHATLISFEEKEDRIKATLKTLRTYHFITLLIDSRTKTLTGWVTKDPQGNEVTMEFSSIQKNPVFSDPDLFVFKKPRRSKKN